MTKKQTFLPLKWLLQTSMLSFCLATTASAQSVWTGGAGNTSWADSANWASGAPSAGQDARIGSSLYNPTSFPLVTSGQSFTVNDLWVGYDGIGSLSLERGGTLTASRLGYIGYLSGGVGLVTVDGSTTLLAIEDDLTLGYAGVGELTITGGALVDSNQYGLLGVLAGSNGHIIIDGARSQLDTANSLSVGVGGNGIVTLTNGGLIATGGNVFIGENSGSHGGVSLSGTGSRWSIGGNLFVGNSGYGELTLANNAQMIMGGRAYIGFNAGSRGEMTVTGATTRWNAPSNVYVGSSGSGTLTVSEGASVSGNNIWLAHQAGSNGTLNIGAEQGAPALAPGNLLTGNLVLGSGDAQIVFNHNDSSGQYSFSPVITGNGQVNFYNGTTTFDQGSSYSGSTNIYGGTLIIDNSTGSATGSSTVNVLSDGTLRGGGFITGAVIVDGTLAPGHADDFGVLTLGSLTLNSGATTKFRLTDPSPVDGFVANDRVDVLGDLTLGGTLDATISAAGTYRLFNYGGSLSGAFGTVVTSSGRPGFDIDSAVIDTSLSGQVNLGVLSSGQSMQFWDGNNTVPSTIAQGAGGSGTWNNANTNWTNSSGSSNGTWGSSVGVFAGAAGEVLIAGEQKFDTLQFLTDGYVLNADPGNGSLAIEAATGTGTLNVEQGISVTVNAPIVDGTGNALLIVNGGTVILNGTNTYTGGTTVYNSAIQISADANLGAATGGLTLEGGIAQWGASFDLDSARSINLAGPGGGIDTHGFNTTLAQGITGNGGLFLKDGAGTLTLTGDNGYTNQTFIRGGTLSLSGDGQIEQSATVQVGSAGIFDISQSNSGATIKSLLGSGAVTLGNQSLTISNAHHTFSGNMSGAGGLNLTGGILNLSGVNAYTGSTAISKGAILELSGAGQISQSQEVTIDADSRLNIAYSTSGVSIVNLTGSGNVDLGSQTLTLTAANGSYAGSINGDGGLLINAGTLTLSGVSEYGGGTQLNVGRLIATNGSALGTGDINLAAGSRLQLAFANSSRLNGIAGNIQIDAGAILFGTGTASGSINNQGTIAALNTLPGYENSGTSNLTVGALSNSGQIMLAGASVGNMLTIKGGLSGQGGRITLHTVLGDDSSASDKLILDGGSTTGTSNLRVLNQNGQGAQTNAGILLVDAINGATTTSDAFVLSSSSSGYRSALDSLAVGAYDYKLLRGGNGGNADSWYLSSTFTGSTEPSVRPEAGAYLANREAAESLFMHSLRDRLDSYQPAYDQTGQTLNSAAWGRVYGSRRTRMAMGETLRSQTDTRALQVGMDLFGQSSEARGSLRAGLMFSSGHASGDTHLRPEKAIKASNEVDAYAVGAYATWFQNQEQSKGGYADAWLQHGWFTNEVKGDGLAAEKYDSRAWSASLEAGYAIPLLETETAKWSFEPSAQLIYTDYTAHAYQEAGGTLIEQNGGKLSVRVGGRFHGQYQTSSGSRIEPFVELNGWHNDAPDHVQMNDDKIYTDTPRNTVELRAGANYRVNKKLFLSADFSSALGAQQYRNVGGQLSVRYAW